MITGDRHREPGAGAHGGRAHAKRPRAAETGTRVTVAVREVDPGKTYRVARSDRTQVVYVLEGKDATLTHTSAGKTAEHKTQRRVGRLPRAWRRSDSHRVQTPLKLFVVTVPKHTGRAGADPSPVGYFFEEARLRSLVDERQIRERTFWVNKETGLSSAWDLQIGRMQYAPHAPIHHATCIRRRKRAR